MRLEEEHIGGVRASYHWSRRDSLHMVLIVRKRTESKDTTVMAS